MEMVLYGRCVWVGEERVANAARGVCCSQVKVGGPRTLHFSTFYRQAVLTTTPREVNALLVSIVSVLVSHVSIDLVAGRINCCW